MTGPGSLRAWNFETLGPSDVSGLRGLLERGEVTAEQVVCVLGKTEGNGGRNDFTRELAMRALEDLLAPRLGVPPSQVQDRVIFSFSGGTEGVVTPHMVVFARGPGASDRQTRGDKRLVVGTGHTRAFRPDEIGRLPQIEETSRALAAIVAGLDLDGPGDVHLVQMKGALPPGVAARNNMVYSRAASALGVGLALGEVPRGRLCDEVVCQDWSLYSSVASCSAKPGLERTELLVFGMSAFAGGELAIAHGVLADILDVDAVRSVARALGARELVGVFAKSEADLRGTIRGRRHTMLSDDDIADTRYSRCVLASVLAATLGETRVYVSTRAEHHGPLGGGPIALLGRVQ